MLYNGLRIKIFVQFFIRIPSVRTSSRTAIDEFVDATAGTYEKITKFNPRRHSEGTKCPWESPGVSEFVQFTSRGL